MKYPEIQQALDYKSPSSARSAVLSYAKRLQGAGEGKAGLPSSTGVIMTPFGFFGVPDATKLVHNPLYAFHGIDEDDNGGFNNDPGDLARAYEVSVWAYRCIRIRAQTLASIPLEVVTDDDKPLSPRDPLSLVFGARNTSLFKIVESDLCVFGKAFLEIALPPLRLNPATVDVVADTNGLQGFIQRLGTAQEPITWGGDEIIYLNDYNPSDDFGTTSPLSYALKAIEVQGSVHTYAEKFFKNGAILAGILTTDQRLSDPELQRLRAEWDKRYKGVEKAHQDAILFGGTKYEPIGATPKDLVMSELREDERREICTAFGVPMSIAQAADPALYAAKQDYINFITLMVKPQLDMIVDGINAQWLTPRSRGRLLLRANYNDVEALQEDRTQVTTRSSVAISAGYMSYNEARERDHLEPLKVDYFRKGDQLIPRAALDSGDLAVINPQSPFTSPFGIPSTPRAPLLTPPSDQPSIAPVNIESTEGLNGAQIDAALRILEGIYNTTTTESVAYELLIALGIEASRAQRMVTDTSAKPGFPLPVSPDSKSVNITIYNGNGATDIIEGALVNNAERDLERWARKASKKGFHTPFESAYIPSAVTAFVRNDILAWDGDGDRDAYVKSVFDWAIAQVKAENADYATPEEFEAYWRGIGDLFNTIASTFQVGWQAVPGRLANVMRETGPQWAESDLRGFLDDTTNEIAVQLVGTEEEPGVLSAVFLAGAARGNDLLLQQKSVKQDVSIAWDVVNKLAVEWAREYSGALIRGINDTTLTVFQQKIAEWIEKGGSLDDLANYIEGDLADLDIPEGWTPGKIAWATSPERARLIASTETTNAYHNGAVSRWEQVGVTKGKWRTQQDNIVQECDICWPLNNVVGNLREGWIHPKTGSRYRPAAHPSCRCFAAPIVE
jgi:HK97 family phage portal protein